MKQHKYSELLLRFQTFDKERAKTFRKVLNNLANVKNFQVSSISLPIEKKKFTILKSPHVNKKAKEQYEIRFYNGIILLKGRFFEREFLQNLIALFPSDILIKISYRSNLCLP